jgi:transposase-like protein
MGHAAKEREQDRKARARLRVLHHCEQVTRNVSQTCRFFGISRSLFYIWRDRYRHDGLVGLRDGPRGPRHHPFTTPAHIVALILQVRRQRQYGPLRISLFLQRYHQVYVSPPTIQRILKRHRVPRVSLKRFRPGPRRRREIHTSPGNRSRSMSSTSTPSNRPRTSSRKCAAACRWPSSVSRRTMAPSLGPTSPGTCGISGSSTGRFPGAAPRPMERSSAAIGRTKTSSTGA